MAQYRYYHNISMGILRKIIQDIQFPGQDSNWAPPKYQSTAKYDFL
jgi:hypothetical protein